MKSRGGGAQVGLQPALDDPEDGLVVAAVRRQGSLGPAMGALRRIDHDRARRAREDGLIEGDRDIGAERLLDARSRPPA